MNIDSSVQSACTTTDSIQILMIVDSTEDANTGVRAIRLERATGNAWMFTGSNGNYAWKAFVQLPKEDTPGSFVVSSVNDGARGIRTMLVNLTNGESWWHETQKGKEVWCKIHLSTPSAKPPQK